MIEKIVFNEKSRRQAEIRVLLDSGEEIVLLFMGPYPLMVKKYYEKAIEDILMQVEFPLSNIDLFNRFARGFMSVRLETPLAVAVLNEGLKERQRIGQRIRELREERNMDARQLASMSNVDAANLCRIEQGKYSVGFDVLTKIASVLGYKIDLVKC